MKKTQNTDLTTYINDVCIKYDLRVGQLIENVKKFHCISDVFYIEDSMMKSLIEQFITKEIDVRTNHNSTY